MIKVRQPTGDTSSRPLVTRAVRRMKAAGRTSSMNSASIVLSCAALVVSIGSVGVGILQTNAAQDQVQIAKQQNRELRDQFAHAGPIVTVSSLLEFPDERPVRTIRDREAPVSAATIAKSQGFLIVELANAGRSATTIESVALKTGPNPYIFSDHISIRLNYSPWYVVYCGTSPYRTKDSPDRTKDCVEEMPYTLDPGKVYYVVFPILPEIHKSIIDNGLGWNGLEIRIYAVGISQRPLQHVSQVRFVD